MSHRLQPFLSSLARVCRRPHGIALLGLMLCVLPASTAAPARGDFTLELNLQERNAASGRDRQADFTLQPGADGSARGTYANAGRSDEPTLDLVFQSARLGRDYVSVKLHVTQFRGPGRYPVATAFGAGQPNLHNRIEVYTGGGAFLDPRETGFSVLRYQTGWRWYDAQHKARTLPDAGGLIEIESVKGNLVTGRLNLVFYGATQGYPGSLHPTDLRRAALTGTFQAQVSGLETR